MKPILLNPPEDFLEETYADFENRYSGFGKDIYLKIKEILPEVFYKLTFYQRQTFQTEDSYAEYNVDIISFVIQLDPLCEVIVLWNGQKQTEIGTWSASEYDEAVNFIKSDLL
jgi:hypothetical protein